jgi:hypothetical protein
MVMILSSRLPVSWHPDFRYVATLSIGLGLTAENSAIGARKQAKLALLHQLARVNDAS